MVNDKKEMTLKTEFQKLKKNAKKVWNKSKPHLKKIGGSPEFLSGLVSDPGKPNVMISKSPAKNSKKKKKENKNKRTNTQAENLNALLGLK